MAKIYEIRKKPVIDDGGDYQNVTAVKAVTTLIASVRLKTGVRAYLVKIGNAVSAGAEDYITWTLKVNGEALDARYVDFSNMITDPSNPEAQLPFEYELPQGALVELYAANSDAANDYGVTGQVQIYYTDL
jgi:hypothetical protein